jgi:hypothetical protein
MANATPSRIGQVNNAGDVDALFLKVYAGEVLTAFTEQNKLADRTMVRNITSGKSAQFPATWKATASYHTPGTEITGNTIAGNERVIVIDDLLISPVFIASIDEAKTHYEVRSEYSKQAGAALARTMDKNLAQVGLLAARASATVTGGNGGSQITAATAQDRRRCPPDRCLRVRPGARREGRAGRRPLFLRSSLRSTTCSSTPARTRSTATSVERAMVA